MAAARHVFFLLAYPRINLNSACWDDFRVCKMGSGVKTHPSFFFWFTMSLLVSFVEGFIECEYLILAYFFIPGSVKELANAFPFWLSSMFSDELFCSAIVSFGGVSLETGMESGIPMTLSLFEETYEIVLKWCVCLF